MVKILLGFHICIMTQGTLDLVMVHGEFYVTVFGNVRAISALLLLDARQATPALQRADCESRLSNIIPTAMKNVDFLFHLSNS